MPAAKIKDFCDKGYCHGRAGPDICPKFDFSSHRGQALHAHTGCKNFGIVLGKLTRNSSNPRLPYRLSRLCPTAVSCLSAVDMLNPCRYAWSVLYERPGSRAKTIFSLFTFLITCPRYVYPVFGARFVPVGRRPYFADQRGFQTKCGPPPLSIVPGSKPLCRPVVSYR